MTIEPRVEGVGVLGGHAFAKDQLNAEEADLPALSGWDFFPVLNRSNREALHCAVYVFDGASPLVELGEFDALAFL